MVAVLQPIKPGKLIPIDRAVVLVGRGSDCDAIITDSQKISRRHCCLVQVDHSYYLRDLGSMNGVWVNGTRVTREAIMKAGDRVSIGDVEFLFHPNARIEQKKAVSSGQPAQKAAAAPASSALPRKGGDVVAEASSTDDNDENDLIHAGRIQIVDDDDDSEDFEVIDDVIPLADDDAYLVETNEVEIINEPLVDSEGFDDDDDDDDDIVLLDED